MTEQLVIDRVGHRGDGVAETPVGPAFVSYTLPGETVTVDAVAGHADRRHLLHVEVPSAERVAPFCPHFGVCGGCAIQHWAADRYRAWKRDLVVHGLAQAGIETPVDDVIDAHGEGRRRAVFHARRGAGDILRVGFAAPRAHDIVAIDHCPILVPALGGALPAAWAIAEVLRPANKPLDIQATATPQGIDIDIRGSGPLAPGRSRELVALAETFKLARLTRHGELIAQRGAPMVAMGRAMVPIPPGAFLQATTEGEATLARLVAGHVADAKRIADLFCGVGPFALRLAERARVTAADNDAGAVAALTRAAHVPGLKPVDAQARDLFRRPFMAAELKGFDAVVFDPPRQGAEAQARALAASTVPFIVAVSCNVASFSRDAAILIGGGYRLAQVTPVDQFRHSAHIELVARFVRR